MDGRMDAREFNTDANHINHLQDSKIVFIQPSTIFHDLYKKYNNAWHVFKTTHNIVGD